jgi:hypothetical protein
VRSRSGGAIIDDFGRLKLFAIEHSDDGAMLVPAEALNAEAALVMAKTVTVSAKVLEDGAAQFRPAAARNGTNASALIAQFVADYVVANV